MNNKQHKEITKKHEILGIIISVLIISTAFFLYDYFTTKQQDLEQENLPNLPVTEIKDFPSSDAGTFEGWIMASGTPPNEPAVLFSSAKIPGLAIVYYPQTQRMVAGLPPMVAENINLFDDKEHNIIYSFEKEGQQFLLIDKQIVSSANYHPYAGNGVTGMVVGLTLGKVSSFVTDVIVK